MLVPVILWALIALYTLNMLVVVGRTGRAPMEVTPDLAVGHLLVLSAVLGGLYAVGLHVHHAAAWAVLCVIGMMEFSDTLYTVNRVGRIHSKRSPRYAVLNVTMNLVETAGLLYVLWHR